MKPFLIALGVLLLLCLLFVALDVWRSSSFRSLARSVKVGDAKQQVEKVLGRATDVFVPQPAAATNFIVALLSVRSETWVYGPRLELRYPLSSEFPYVQPFRFRLFSPDADDVAVEFDASGKVRQVNIPTNGQ